MFQIISRFGKLRLKNGDLVLLYTKYPLTDEYFVGVACINNIRIDGKVSLIVRYDLTKYRNFIRELGVPAKNILCKLSEDNYNLCSKCKYFKNCLSRFNINNCKEYQEV